ncbi:MAG TPA: nitrogenase component 1 [Polyangiaceae bacterium]|nr:nitrogenase component 1 [Polyangiaceae bacterium]
MTVDESAKEASTDDLSVRAALPRTVGSTVAINAVPDAYLLIDSPHCTYRRIAYVQGNHDYMSTLAWYPDTPRVTNTELTPLDVIRNRDEAIVRELLSLTEHPQAGVVLVDAMAMALITATDYDRLCARAKEKTTKPVLRVPHRSLTSDHLTGYADVMEALASGLPLHPNPSKTGNRVGLVGYYWDRNEGDHRGNMTELERIADALGLEWTTPWLSGSPSSALRDIENAQWIVSLPYGRKAAQILAKRLGCPLLRAEYPFGLAASLRFIVALGVVTGRLSAALTFVQAELETILPRLAWVVPFALLHRRIGFLGDPHLVLGMQEMASLWGCTMPFAATSCLPRHARDSAPDYGNALHDPSIPEDVRTLMNIDQPVDAPSNFLSYPHVRELVRELEHLAQEQRLDVLVTNSLGFLTKGIGIVEFGFPSYHTHALIDRPFVGLLGFLTMMERVVNALRAHEVQMAQSSGGV